MENMVQLFDAESHAIGISQSMELMMRWQNSFLTNVSKKNGYVYFPDNIDIE